MAVSAVPEAKSAQLHPRSLVLALLGELHRVGDFGPYRAVDLIGVLAEVGVSQAAARAALDRLVLRGVLSRDSGGAGGRGISYRLTPAGEQVIAGGAARVHADHPFAPEGDGWTLITFSVPEGRRGLRHRLRSVLIWAGFGPLRDGVWVAAGERDPDHVLEALGDDIAGADIVAFRARDISGFSMAERVDAAWDLPAIRAEHERFLRRWGEAARRPESVAPLAALTVLVADWLDLLRKDPCLPAAYLGDDWPADRSHAAYRAVRARYEASAPGE